MGSSGRSLLLFAVLALFVSIPSSARQDNADVQIETVPVADNVYMLIGRGGNIGVSVGDDGVILIDDQFAPLSEKIQEAVAALSDGPIRFVVNTHWHGDHTGGNENMGKAGALIVAHENVRARMSVDQFMEAFDRTVPASPPAALPVITFTDAVTFHWNGDDINVFHVNTAHTDGDAIIHFTKSNAFHMGDTFFKGRYPFIDVSSGGTLAGIINAADHVLARADEDSKIIPGHGSLATKEDLQAYRDVLQTIHDRIAKLMDEGKSVEEVVAAKPTSDYDDPWGTGFMQADQWVSLVYASMK